LDTCCTNRSLLQCPTLRPGSRLLRPNEPTIRIGHQLGACLQTALKSGTFAWISRLARGRELNACCTNRRLSWCSSWRLDAAWHYPYDPLACIKCMPGAGWKPCYEARNLRRGTNWTLPSVHGPALTQSRTVAIVRYSAIESAERLRFKF